MLKGVWPVAQSSVISFASRLVAFCRLGGRLNSEVKLCVHMSDYILLEWINASLIGLSGQGWTWGVRSSNDSWVQYRC